MNHHDLRKKRWTELQDVFLDVVDLPAKDRESKLAGLGEEDAELELLVRDLLRHDAGPEPEAPPLRFGPYVALRPIGSGGMGDVYLARRSDGAFEREVAVKVIRSELASGDVLERFQRERQTLAGLEHDSIVRLLDGGATESGHPYLVMEYVDGVPLDRFVAAKALTVAHKMQLARQIAEAVGHAHGRGVVHRDLKPSNILVRPDGEPRLLDFGIARSLDTPGTSDEALTRTGHRLFTPRYASPEQVRGDEVSAATDVFALGVLMYELLAGASPWSAEASDFELEREIAESLPVAPSRRAKGTARLSISGDFDTITLKCLAQDPGRRYGDARLLADDLGRSLEGRTILARPSTTVERGWRLVKRRPWHTLAAGATLIALMALALVFRRDRAEAYRHATLVESLPLRMQVIEDLLADRELEVAEESLETLLGETAAVDLQPASLARLELIRGTLAKKRNDWQGSLDHATLGVELLVNRSSDPEAELFLRLAFEQGSALAALGRFGESEELLRESWATCVRRLGPSNERTLSFGGLLGRVLTATGRKDDAIVTLMEAREGFAGGSPTDHSVPLARVDVALGRALGDVYRDEEAIKYLESALDAFQWHSGTRNFKVAETLVFLSRSYDSVGRSVEALEAAQTASQAYQDLGSHLRELLTRRMAAELCFRARDLDAAREHLERCHKLLTSELSDRVDYAHEIHFRLGRVLLELGEPKLAVPHLRAATTDWPEKGSEFGPSVREEAEACLARALAANGDA